MNYKVNLSIFLVKILFSYTLVNRTFAQKTMFTGYVVTNQGDTVKGKIPYDIGTNKNFHVVDVKDDKGYVKKFNVWQIKMYCVKNEFYYTKKCERGETEHRNDLVFMHLLQNGKLKLYEYEYMPKIAVAKRYEEGGMDYVGEKDFYIEKVDGSFIYFPRPSYKKVLDEALKDQLDCLALTEEKDFEYKRIPEVIKCYNNR
jgi:hypothetical protein